MNPAPPPLVSVIIPTYNRAALLLEAVDSVLAQSFRDFELIVVDDGSTDDSLSRLAARGFAVACPGPGLPDPGREGGVPLFLLPLERRGTPGRARNRGAERARGRFLAFLDSDDLWHPDKLALQLRLLTSRGADGADPPRLTHTRELWLRNGREVSQARQRHRREGDLFAESLVKCVIGPSTAVLDRELFLRAGGFREDMEIAEDYELWVRLTTTEKAAYLDRPLTVKRAGSGDQLSEKHRQIEIFRIHALRDLVDRGFFASRPERAAPAREELARKCAIYAAGCRKRGRAAEAAAYENLAAFYRRRISA